MGRLVGVANVAILFKILFTHMMGRLCCGALFVVYVEQFQYKMYNGIGQYRHVKIELLIMMGIIYILDRLEEVANVVMLFKILFTHMMGRLCWGAHFVVYVEQFQYKMYNGIGQYRHVK